MATERELKFSTTDEHVPSLAELRLALEPSRLELASPQVSWHVDVYYDDTRGSLLRSGWALRRRSSDESTVVTLKSATTSIPNQAAPPLHVRNEFNVELTSEVATSSGGWPAELGSQLPPSVVLESLRPQVELRVRRVVFLASLGGVVAAELAFDEVVCAPASMAAAGSPLHEIPHFTFHEVEIEDKEEAAGGGGATAAMMELAEAVDNLLPLTASITSKFERATTLLGPFLEDPSGTA